MYLDVTYELKDLSTEILQYLAGNIQLAIAYIAALIEKGYVDQENVRIDYDEFVVTVDGAIVGPNVGAADGMFVGEGDGDCVGELEGVVGVAVGASVIQEMVNKY